MTEFYLPYQFIPVTGKVNGDEKEKTAYEDLGKETPEGKAKSPARHDLWLDGTRSGRIVCRLHLVTPTMVGNRHGEGHPTPVSPYTRDGKPAIPANSLRGMIGSVAEMLSQSALRVLEDRFHKYFEEIHEDLAPWKPERKKLTPAELLFGVVEQEKGTAEGSRNLASRLRFSDAQRADTVEHAIDADKALKILSSPKPLNEDVPDKLQNSGKFNPETVSTYFHDAQQADNTIRRCDLKPENPSPRHRPNGRKVYLLHWDNSWTSDPTKQKDQKAKCRPLKQGQDFFFHVDFDNLTNAELTLLMTALHPDKSFCHRLGLGKSLGLGAVKITIEGVFLADRRERYGLNALKQSRYRWFWYPHDAGKPDEWPKQYETERSAAKVFASRRPDDFKCDRALIDDDTLNRLLTATIRLKPGVSVRWRGNDSAQPLPEVPTSGKLPALKADSPPPGTDPGNNRKPEKEGGSQRERRNSRGPFRHR